MPKLTPNNLVTNDGWGSLSFLRIQMTQAASAETVPKELQQ